MSKILEAAINDPTNAQVASQLVETFDCDRHPEKVSALVRLAAQRLATLHVMTTELRWMVLQVNSGMIIIRSSQYDGLLAFYRAWEECEVATVTGDSNLLKVASKTLNEKRVMLEAELRVPSFSVVRIEEESSWPAG
jgi:hypothetical protein